MNREVKQLLKDAMEYKCFGNKETLPRHIETLKYKYTPSNANYIELRDNINKSIKNSDTQTKNKMGSREEKHEISIKTESLCAFYCDRSDSSSQFYLKAFSIYVFGEIKKKFGKEELLAFIKEIEPNYKLEVPESEEIEHPLIKNNNSNIEQQISEAYQKGRAEFKGELKFKVKKYVQKTVFSFVSIVMLIVFFGKCSWFDGYVTTWNVSFKRIDQDSLWTYPKLSFYQPFWYSKDKYIVKAEGLYRKKTNNDSVYLQDSTFNHIGIATQVGQFLHINLYPTFEDDSFGEWHAIIDMSNSDIKMFVKSTDEQVNLYGLGGGVSGYKTPMLKSEGTKIDKISNFVIICQPSDNNNLKNQQELMNFMLKSIGRDSNYQYLRHTYIRNN